MPKLTRWAIKTNDTFLVSMDEDGRETIPLFRNEMEADEAASRSDLDEWTLVPVDLE
jgi:hypothetical protein